MSFVYEIPTNERIITPAELFGIDFSKATPDLDLFAYDVLSDDNDIVNIVDVRVMWDTGAEISCINKTLSDKLNLPIVGDINLTMANNNSENSDLVLAAIRLNDILGYRLQLGSFYFEEDYDIIIGLDIISQGKLIIDYISSSLEFISSGDIIKDTGFGNVISIIKM